MHLQFYHLNRPPFQLATDLDFFWEGKNYNQSFDVLRYSLEHHGGLSLLTGKAGSGKSMIVRALLNALGDTVRAAVIPDSSLTGQEFYDLVAHGFDLTAGIENRQDFHGRIHILLQEARENNQQVLLVVDEAQQLSRELIDEIGELIDLQPVDSGGLGICLVGQADTAQDLVTLISQAFEDHVIVRYHLAPFTAEETEKYIRHRLKVAGTDQPVFTDDAIREIHRCSGGYPGQINIICDLALFTGYTETAAEIGPAVIRTSAAKLQFPDMQAKSGDICPTVTPADLEIEGENPAPDEKNEAASVTKDVAESVVAAAAGGRSFTLPALAVLMALVFIGGGYALYTKRDDAQLSATPVVVDPPPVVDTTAPPAQKTGKEQAGFDAVGYSPPREEDFSRKQPVGGETITAAATDMGLVSAGEDAEEAAGKTTTAVPEFSRDRLKVQALQVEESLSTIPVAEEVSTPEPVDVKTPSPQESVATAVAEEAVAETETVLEEQTVEVTSAAESVVEQSVVNPESAKLLESSVTSTVALPGNDTAGTTVPAVDEIATVELVDAETSPLQESVPAAVGEEAASGMETVLEKITVEVTPAAEPVVGSEPVREQQQAMDVDTPVAETGREMEKNTDVPMSRVRKHELEHFFEAGAFASQSSSAPQVIKTTQHARMIGASPQKASTIDPTPQPDPEDVIDWLLKKKEQHAQ